VVGAADDELVGLILAGLFSLIIAGDAEAEATDELVTEFDGLFSLIIAGDAEAVEEVALALELDGLFSLMIAGDGEITAFPAAVADALDDWVEEVEELLDPPSQSLDDEVELDFAAVTEEVLLPLPRCLADLCVAAEEEAVAEEEALEPLGDLVDVDVVGLDKPPPPPTPGFDVISVN